MALAARRMAGSVGQGRLYDDIVTETASERADPVQNPSPPRDAVCASRIAGLCRGTGDRVAAARDFDQRDVVMAVARLVRRRSVVRPVCMRFMT